MNVGALFRMLAKSLNLCNTLLCGSARSISERKNLYKSLVGKMEWAKMRDMGVDCHQSNLISLDAAKLYVSRFLEYCSNLILLASTADHEHKILPFDASWLHVCRIYPFIFDLLFVAKPDYGECPVQSAYLKWSCKHSKSGCNQRFAIYLWQKRGRSTG